jgi:UDP-N-acetylmuramate dehydrogenase
MTFPMSINYDLTGYNTLGLRASSHYARRIEHEAELPELFATADRDGLPVRLLGGGSNVILGEHYEGITALMATRGRALSEDGAGDVLLEARAGETWHDLVVWTVSQGLWGLENLALIPGTVGAAPIQNIGAYGVELCDRFHSLDAYDRSTDSVVTLDAAACRFAYRHSVFKEQPGRYVVTRVRLNLTRHGKAELGYRELSGLGPVEHPATVMDAVIKLRTAKLPDWRVLGNAGSFFHNPVVSATVGRVFAVANPTAPAYPQGDGAIKLSAGWLIEQAGLKGYRQGKVGVSERHALVLVNYGGATRTDLMALADHVVAAVQQRFAITLRREPELL